MYDTTDEGHYIVTLSLDQILTENSVAMSTFRSQFFNTASEALQKIYIDIHIRSRVDNELRKILDTS